MKNAIIIAAIITPVLIACHPKNTNHKKQQTMFTVEQIKAAHSKVRSGADFPAYIRDIKNLGVTGYETYVTDGHTDYHGADNFTTTSPARYDALPISDTTDTGHFKNELKAHQQGKTTYTQFIETCAATGVEKWVVDMAAMTCVYYDKKGNEVLAEQIPVVD